MIFSEDTIKQSIKEGLLKIYPFSEDSLGKASYDLHLDISEEIILAPADFIVLKTTEKITLSPGIACFITTTGHVARLGIDVAQSSIFCEPDTDNKITLEISNATKQAIQLLPHMKIAKAVFVKVV